MTKFASNVHHTTSCCMQFTSAKNHWILSTHSNTTSKNVSWPYFSWPTLYIAWHDLDTTCINTVKVIHFGNNRFLTYDFLIPNSNFCSRTHRLATIHSVHYIQTDSRQRNRRNKHHINIASRWLFIRDGCEASWFDSISNRTSDSIRIDGPIQNFRIVALSVVNL